MRIPTEPISSVPRPLRFASLSGIRMDTDLKQSTAAGFSRHLVKPIDMATLLDAR